MLNLRFNSYTWNVLVPENAIKLPNLKVLSVDSSDLDNVFKIITNREFLLFSLICPRYYLE